MKTLNEIDANEVGGGMSRPIYPTPIDFPPCPYPFPGPFPGGPDPFPFPTDPYDIAVA